MPCEAEQIGQRCEEMAADICRCLGFHVADPPSRRSPYDWVVNGKRLQVKRRTTNPSRRGRFELKTSMRGKGYAYCSSDLDAFAVLFDGAWIVFPVAVVATEDGFIPNDIPVKRVAAYRDCWNVLAGDHVPCERQLGFDF